MNKNTTPQANIAQVPKKQPEFSYYARKSSQQEDIQEDNIPLAPPVSPLGRYFVVGNSRFYTGTMGALLRSQNYDGRPHYWLDVIGHGEMYFAALEITEISQAEFEAHFQKWRRENTAT